MAQPSAIGASCVINNVVAIQSVSQPISGVMTEEVILPAAQAGAITAGVLALNAGHGIVTGNRLDVYWAGGSRIGCLVGTVAGNSVPISGGTGTTLPAAAATPITCMVPQVKPFAILATNIQAVIVVCAGAGFATAAFTDATPTPKGSLQIGTIGSYIWYNLSGIANPITADPTQVFLSHSDATAGHTIQLVVGVL